MKRCRVCGVERPQSAFNAETREPDGLSPRCRPCDNAKSRAYAARTRERRRVYDANRRARRLGLVADLTLEQWLAKLAAYENECAYCTEPYETIDHVQPLCRGGGSTIENVVPACHDCNRRKGMSTVRSGVTCALP